jgi:L,D-peptidoglycan transpeptidase YkuD (ErfK/YbiS/YcfS/YnhG family)
MRMVFPHNLEKAAGSSRQALIVSGENGQPFRAKAALLERREGQWILVKGPVRATAGRNGFAGGGLKREGDGKTPSGIFPLTLVFGYEPSVPTKMPYRQASADDVWVDDPESADYNRWVGRDSAASGSFEEMRRSDDLYKCGIVIGYNMDPIVPDLGSAIFVHVWAAEDAPTSGCIAMSEEDLLSIIGRLDAALRPIIIVAPGLF